MLKKLFKYDMRSISRLLLPIMLLVLGTTVLGSVALKLLLTSETWYVASGSLAGMLFEVALGVVAFGSMFLVIFFAAFSIIMIAARFYKHLFTDEGYLTHTLPASTTTHLFSKLWSAMLWQLIAVAAVLVYILIYTTFGAAPVGQFINTEFYEDVGQAFHFLFNGIPLSGIMICIEVVICILIASVFSILTIFLAITIGSIVAKKHKILAAIGFYYLINTAVSILMQIFFGVTSYSWATSWAFVNNSADSILSYFHTVLIVSIIACLILAACAFTLCNHFLKKKLNLA